MLLWCVLTTALARGVDPVTTFDYTGDWDVGGKALITIARDARGVLVVRVNVPNEADDASATFMDPTGCLRFSTRGRRSAYHCLRFGDPDTLLDDVVFEGPNGGSSEVFVLHRSTPALREAARRQLVDAEVAGNVNGLKTAELAYEAAFDQFVSVPLWPRPLAGLNGAAVRFEDPAVPPEYQQIGWRPDGLVTGTYSVDVSADGVDFTVNGWQDLDGDGVPAHWQASRLENAHRVTPEAVR